MSDSEPSVATASLLDRRMRLLGLSREEIVAADPARMQQLEQACGACRLKARCSRDLRTARSSAAVAAYCPNEPALSSLR